MRKNSTQLAKEYHNLNGKVLACGARIIERAQELVKQYPDLNIKSDTTSDEIITTQQWIDIINLYNAGDDYQDTNFIILSYIKIIKFIEDYISSQHPHQQQKLF